MKFALTLIILFLNFNLLYGTEKKVDQNIIHKNLRCLVCQGQSIADSNSDFAQTIKLVVKDLIKDGKTEDEIYSFMVEKYGEWIVFKPQLNKHNLMLWFLPYLALILGGIIILLMLKRRRNL
jgi:cytochrome c-type biogenesis protein CcmH|tara:strand:+ start:489 stop:854 length:366 start_codon:yes stop_codon:yes gene_type:complete